MKRSYKSVSGGYKRRGALSKRRRVVRRGGLVPIYRGFQPRQFQRGEWKYSDVAISQSVNTTGFQLLLNGLKTGNTAVTRIGMKVSIRSLELRGYFYATVGTGVDQLHRYLVMIDRQCNAAAPTLLSDYLYPANILGLRNLANRKRFKNTYDRSHCINAPGEPGTFKAFHVYLKFRRPLVVEFNAADNGNEADIVSNSLWLVGVGSEAAGATAGSIQGVSRIRYTDI